MDKAVHRLVRVWPRCNSQKLAGFWNNSTKEITLSQEYPNKMLYQKRAADSALHINDYKIQDVSIIIKGWRV